MGDSGRPLWQTTVSLLLALLVVLLVLPVVVRSIREQGSGRTRLMRQQVARTRHVTRDLRKGRPVDAADLPLAQAVVDGTSTSVRLTAVMLAPCASSAFSGATARSGLAWLPYGAAVLTFLAATLGGVTTRSIRRGGARNGLRPGGAGP